jgi:FkbM family methyltransferase
MFLRYIAYNILKIQKIHGAWFFRRPGEHVFELASRYDAFEGSEIKFFSEFLKRGQVVFDVGANFGIYSLLASKRVGPTGRVVAFEPAPRTIRCLRNNCFLNLASNVERKQLALSDSNGWVEFNFAVDQPAYSGIQVGNVPGRVEKIRVESMTLDSFCEKRKPAKIDMLKVDVEGAERAFLNGARQTLTTYKPTLLMEFSPLRTRPSGYEVSDLYSILDNLGYILFCFNKAGRLEVYDSQKYLNEEKNIVGVPRGAESSLSPWIETNEVHQ